MVKVGNRLRICRKSFKLMAVLVSETLSSTKCGGSNVIHPIPGGTNASLNSQ